jgi:hypothetical protein
MTLLVRCTGSVVGFTLAGRALLSGPIRCSSRGPDKYAASSEAIIVADSATERVANDLAGFGSAVLSWRASADRKR